MRFSVVLHVAVAMTLVSTASGHAQKKYDPGASDTEITLGQTLPYSGPVSVLSGVGKGETAYFKYLNESQSGINGRKVTLLSLDDGYSAPKTMELTRQLVERDNVLAIVNTVGTATNRAIHRYLNQKKVPQLLILSGAAQWNDPAHNPWTMMGMIAYRTEGTVYARHVLAANPKARIAVLRQNDDYGKDYVEGFREALGPNASAIVLARPPAASHVYFVSHQRQPTSQPCRRRKCAGVPTEGPSPWSERKCSETRRSMAWCGLRVRGTWTRGTRAPSRCAW